ncbi:conserved hypothetical protein [Pediculus humanus corporis]|uniref:PRORP domain-containing protein n=1 Tax=Pediculus humanus subsp. corporis TaxID=121224 RepID=E0VLH9_PEDHC|nr:uncharacterized protein Phum_PHUM288220 [Pediculus humanus corporis]EEB14235.1 conserved hypothetical protein [Pediculus humanus corporis]
MFKLRLLNATIQKIINLNFNNNSKLWLSSVNNSYNLLNPVVKHEYLLLSNKIIQDYSNLNNNIPWNEIKNEIFTACGQINSNFDYSHSLILNSLGHFKMIDFTVSYYKYLTCDYSKTIPVSECYKVMSILAKDEKKSGQYNDCLHHIYSTIKPHMSENPLIFLQTIIVFGHLNESYLNELKEIFYNNDNLNSSSILNYLVSTNFEYDAKESWSLIKKHSLLINNKILEAYLNYCQRMAENNKFHVSLISDLISYCHENSQFLPDPLLFESLTSLVNILNERHNLKWSVKITSVSNTGFCSQCKSNIGKADITMDELEKLKKYFISKVFIGRNININSTDKELNRFLHFLKKTDPYDVVIDHLNIKYLQSKNLKVSNLIQYFEKQNKKILFITRKHTSNEIKEICNSNHCQYYYTDNLSSDDLFTIYAAMQKDLNTYFFSKDFLKSHSSLIDDSKLKNVFIKWQWSHQYTAIQSNKIVSFYSFAS